MADAPDTIVLTRHRDLDGRSNEIWIRRGLFVLLCVLPVLALRDVFGQRPSSTTATTDAAVLDVHAPAHVRGGLLFEARLHVTARRDLAQSKGAICCIRISTATSSGVIRSRRTQWAILENNGQMTFVKK